MTTSTQIQFPLFAPAAPVDNPAQLLRPTQDNKQFENMLDQKIQQPHLDRAERRPRPEPEHESRTRDDIRSETSYRSARQEQTDTPAETPRTPKERVEATHGQRKEHAAKLGNGDTTPVNQRDAKAAENLTPEQKLVRHLKDLNIEQDRIDKILNTIRQGAGGEQVIAALADFLGTMLGGENAAQLAQASGESSGDKALQTLISLFQNQTGPTDAARTQGEQVQQALEALKHAGLTQEEAKRLLAAARQGNLPQSAEDLRAKLAQVTDEGPLTKVKTEAQPQTVRGSAEQLQADETPISTELKKLSEMLGQKTGDTGSARPNPASANPTQVPANGLLTAAQNVNPQSVTPANPTTAVSSTAHMEGGNTQPSGSVGDNTSRPGEVARAAVSESYTPRGLVEKPIAQQIVEKFSIRGVGQQKEVFIKLDPPSLGTVRMNVSTAGDHVKTTLVAETQAAKQTIENNLAQLKDSLAGQGIKVDSFTVLVGGNPGESAHQRHSGLGAQRPFGTQHEIAVPVEGMEEVPQGRSPVFYYPSQSISLFA